MSTWIAGAWETFRKLSPVPLLAVGVASLIVLLLPPGTAAWLGLEELRSQYRPYIGGACLAAWSYLGAYFIWWIGQRVSMWRKRRRVRLQNEQYLHDLTPEEKAYLVPYVLRDEAARNFAHEDGVAGALKAKGILYRSASLGSLEDGVAHSIQPWAKKYLKDHKELLEGAGPPPLSPRERWESEVNRW